MRYPKHTLLVREELERVGFMVFDSDHTEFAFCISNKGSDVILNIPKDELTKKATVDDRVGHVITLYIQAVDRK